MKARKTLMVQQDLHRSMKYAALQRNTTIEHLADELLRLGLGLKARRSSRKTTDAKKK